jgi:uncharacterized protein YcaQ
MITLTNIQARRFILLKQGLLGDYRFSKKEGALAFIKQAGCIQFDPVNVCGKNADITLQSRVEDYSKEMLEELLYQDRLLFDYPDKVLSIIPMEYWAYFARYRKEAKDKGRDFDEIAKLEEWTKDYIEKHGAVSSKELPIDGKAKWHSTIFWSGNWQGESNVARSVLEQLYSAGELVIHHKKGTRKYYDLAINHIKAEKLQRADPLPDDFDHQKWRVLRRIGAVGLLWDRASDAWLNIWGLKGRSRTEVIAALVEEGKIIPVVVEGIKETLYCREEDRELLEVLLLYEEDEAQGDKGKRNERQTKESKDNQVIENKTLKKRCEFIAPLDPFMWDRKLIKALFDFEYTWEIYTPAHKRKYGAYVMPILYGEEFIGRIQLIHNRKENIMEVKNCWLEDGVKEKAKIRGVIKKQVKKFARFSDCKNVVWED